MYNTLIRLKDIFNEPQRTNITYLYKSYKIEFTQKKFRIKRFDNKLLTISCDCISLADIDKLLEMIKQKYNETKNMNIRFSLKTVEEMKMDIEKYLIAKKGKEQLKNICNLEKTNLAIKVK